MGRAVILAGFTLQSLILGGGHSKAYAQEAPLNPGKTDSNAQTQAPSRPADEDSIGLQKSVESEGGGGAKKSGGGKRTREKEAEGTEARDRFKADTVIKSKYKLDGEPLEVDPD